MVDSAGQCCRGAWQLAPAMAGKFNEGNGQHFGGSWQLAGLLPWSMDFMRDQLSDGRSFRLFNVLDDSSRERLGIEID